jgi:hypothetical protein
MENEIEKEVTTKKVVSRKTKKEKNKEVLKMFVTNQEGDLEIMEVELLLKSYLIKNLNLLTVPTKERLVELIELYNVK